MKEINEEKYDKAMEWLQNALINLGNLQLVGLALLPIIKEQLENAIKYLEDEDVDEEVFGSLPKE